MSTLYCYKVPFFYLWRKYFDTNYNSKKSFFYIKIEIKSECYLLIVGKKRVFYLTYVYILNY